MTRTFKPAITQKTINHENNRFINSGRRLSAAAWEFKEIFPTSRQAGGMFISRHDYGGGLSVVYKSLGFSLTAKCGVRLVGG